MAIVFDESVVPHSAVDLPKVWGTSVPVVGGVFADERNAEQWAAYFRGSVEFWRVARAKSGICQKKTRHGYELLRQVVF